MLLELTFRYSALYIISLSCQISRKDQSFGTVKLSVVNDKTVSKSIKVLATNPFQLTWSSGSGTGIGSLPRLPGLGTGGCCGDGTLPVNDN